MEQERMKRAREGNEESENNKAKKRDVSGIKLTNEVGKEKEGFSSEMGLGVFDFPWLKDGVTSISEDYSLDFEDKLSSLLEQEDAAASIHPMAHIPEANNLEDLTWQTFESDMLKLEAEDVDCIWSFLLNQTL
ncbi:uncharacterized protein LOC109811333 [Cajanus cajan]|uniref:Uncharacterized protein n=1 Tax=Cajanus cajan TaxID=3821 RepID=A0A151SBK8_CAJCA|nr:uncharacterized protein LOC109811333 [Cajanus cajan]XP_029129818.1 uncharacterized protein LOC109811333 [Cajanus cajan]KYP52119.1 hypothetical protein KK1_026031 [Cajanus cajan]